MPNATPSICLCILLLKLNSTEVVVMFISSIKTSLSMLRGVKLFSYKESAQIWIVYTNGMLVKRLEISNEHRKVLSGVGSQLLNNFSKGKRIFNTAS